LGSCQLAAMFVTCLLASGAGGYFPPALTIPAARAAEAPAATGRAWRIMIAEARVTI
jgi:hypothetical protein